MRTMALSESHQSTVTIRRADEVSTDDTVRHVDQLTHEELSTFLGGVDGASAGTGQLEAGEIIVFTDQFRIDAH